MGPRTPQYVRPLGMAENQFLQVLATQFQLRRRGKGTELALRFSSDTPAIWLRRGREEVHRHIPDFDRKVRAYQERLDTFLVSGEGRPIDYRDPQFPFRYASGGVLPVVRMGGQDYFCLFYREVFPAGWNIANGMCDTSHELLNPRDAVERELREELLIVDSSIRNRYVFEGETGRWLGLPECALARRLWDERFRDLNFPPLSELNLPLRWLDGPDSVRVEFERPNKKRDVGGADGIFLNINAEDFGIEVDRIVQLNIGPDAILCDGEILAGRLLDRIVGLFSVGRLLEGLRQGSLAFEPDILFHGARRYDAKAFRRVLTRDYLPSVRAGKAAPLPSSASIPLDLCPVTRRIIRRYIATQGQPPVVEGEPCDVFISFGQPDLKLANTVYDSIHARTSNRVFFSKETVQHSSFYPQINEALDSATHLIAVASRPEHLGREWVRYEWETFHAAILSGRKRRRLSSGGKPQLLSFIKGFKAVDLPTPLWRYQAVEVTRRGLEPALTELLRFVH